MDYTKYPFANTYYYISVGLFGYDTTYLQRYASADYDHFFKSGLYDGWSMGSIMYFEYYKFTDDMQSFGACTDNGYCWGAWLTWDSTQEYYYAYAIGFIYRQEISAYTPKVPAKYDKTYHYEWYYSLRTYYLTGYTWEYLQHYGALFFRWMPVNDPRPDKGDRADFWTFSSLSLDKKNRKTEQVKLNLAGVLATSAALALSASALI